MLSVKHGCFTAARTLPSWLSKTSLVAVGVAGALGGAWYLMQPSTYEECMLVEMRGQIQAMYATVDKLCSRRHRREVSVGRESLNWNYRNFHVYIERKASDSEHVLTKGRFQFSSRDCKDAKDSDFVVERTEKALDDGTFFFPLDPTIEEFKAFSNPVCMRTLQLWGRYR